MKKIIIDPGHGGTDPGAVYKGYLEKNFTFDISLSAANYLEHHYQAAKVYLTRKTDKTVTLNERSVFANDLDADLFVSVHVNAGGGTGFESFIYTNAGSKTGMIRKTIHDEVSDFFKQQGGFPDRGKKVANFSVIRNTKMPAVLLENLFIDNPKDIAQLLLPGFTEKLGVTIARGIVKALNLSAEPVIKPDQKPEPGPSPSTSSPAWQPEKEIERLMNTGLIVNKHLPTDAVNWGEFATVINRLLGKITQK